MFILLCVFHDVGERQSSLFLYWFCICFVKMHLTVVGGCQMFVVGMFYIVFYDFGVLEGPTGSICCILYVFYKCFAKIVMRVCGGLPVFQFCLFYFVVLMISVNVTVHSFYISFAHVL